MKIQFFAILLIIKTFLLSQNAVEAGPKSCTTKADCSAIFNEECELNAQLGMSFCTSKYQKSLLYWKTEYE